MFKKTRSRMILSTCDYLELPNVGKCQRNEKRKNSKNLFYNSINAYSSGEKNSEDSESYQK